MPIAAPTFVDAGLAGFNWNLFGASEFSIFKDSFAWSFVGLTVLVETIGVSGCFIGRVIGGCNVISLLDCIDFEIGADVVATGVVAGTAVAFVNSEKS